MISLTPKIDYMMKIGEMDIDNALESFGAETQIRLLRAKNRYLKTGEDTVFPKRFPQSAKIAWKLIKKCVDFYNIVSEADSAKITRENHTPEVDPAKITRENCTLKLILQKSHVKIAP